MGNPWGRFLAMVMVMPKWTNALKIIGRFVAVLTTKIQVGYRLAVLFCPYRYCKGFHRSSSYQVVKAVLQRVRLRARFPVSFLRQYRFKRKPENACVRQPIYEFPQVHKHRSIKLVISLPHEVGNHYFPVVPKRDSLKC